MAARADVAVIGLGAMGSASVLAMARRGRHVLGIDRHHPPHIHGSSHGRSRIIREAYYESSAYVPLVRRAWTLWRELERATGRTLLRQTGGLMLGLPETDLIRGARQSAEEHRIAIELLGAEEIRRRFPVLHPPTGTIGVLEPNAGFLDPEGCIEAMLELSERAGAELRFETVVTGWHREGDGVRVETSAGPIDCDRLVLAAGPWLPELPGGSGLPLTVERQVLAWFEPRMRGDAFGPERFPVFLWEWEPGRLFYGFPDDGAGFKIALHHEGDVASATTVRREVTEADLRPLRSLLQRFIPDADGLLRQTATCLYTNTPDRHFILGPDPGEPRVILASPCSGHGFKFATAIGEVVADLVEGRAPPFDLAPFAPARFR